MVGVALRTAASGCTFVGVGAFGLCFLGAWRTHAKEFKVVDAIAHAHNPVATDGLVYLNACHAEVQHAR